MPRENDETRSISIRHPEVRGPQARLRASSTRYGPSLRMTDQQFAKRDRALAPQFGQILVERERFRVGQRLGVLHITPMHDIAHRKLGDLAGARARDVGDRNDLRWD